MDWRVCSNVEGLRMAEGLTVVTYNTYRDSKGRDAVLDALLCEGAEILCLQEVSMARAWKIKHRFGPRAYLSPVMHGWQFLAIVLPENARFVRRRALQLNNYAGVLLASWSLQRSYELYRSGRRSWRDGLATRVAQVAQVAWEGREFRLINVHLPYEPRLRDRCLSILPGVAGAGDVLLAGDLNATTDNVFLNDLLLATGLRPAGTNASTHDGGRRIDYVLFRGGFRETSYSLEKGRSDHRVVRAELELTGNESGRAR